MKEGLSRREFIGGVGAAAIGAAACMPSVAAAMAARPKLKRKRVLRIAHLTDIHVQPEGIAAAGMARALRSAQSLDDKPDIIFTGGDSIMDSLGADKARTKAQWEIFQKVLKNECSLPVVHCIGNHDVWGWGLDDESVRKDSLYGKQWAIEEFGLESRYYSFDKTGWHFIVLDSTYQVERTDPEESCYTAKLDEEQFEWLKKELKEVPKEMPICVLSHIPIICFCAFLDGDNEKSGDWVVPGAWMHIDARQIKDLFKAHKNVRLCLSGHMHMQDAVEYLGVEYLCDGAVSGAWWDGSHYDFPPAYVVVDLYNDGTSRSEYITYEWKAASPV
jgi:predicted MPP superfamily phosphohydrolase